MIQSTAKICHLGLGWFDDHAGGLERYQLGICRAHAREGSNVQAMVLSKTPIVQKPEYQAIAYASPSESRRIRAKKLRQHLSRWVDQTPSGPQYLVSHHASVASTVLDLVKRLQHRGGEFVVQFHGPWAEEARVEGAGRLKTLLQHRMECRVYRSADRILTLSHAFADLIVNHYGVSRAKVFTVPGAIDSDLADSKSTRSDARQRLQWDKNAPTIVCVRRLVHRVGIDVLIKAMEQITASIPNVRLMIGGRGPLLDQLQTQVRDAKLEGSIHLLGFVPDDQLPHLYSAGDVSIVSKQSLEGFGLITLESMACGTPVLVTPVGSLPEVVTPLNPKLVLNGCDPSSIAEGLIHALRNPTSLPTAGECRRYVREHFDWSVIAPQVMQVYSGINPGCAIDSPLAAANP